MIPGIVAGRTAEAPLAGMFVGSRTYTYSSDSSQLVSLTILKDENNNNAVLQPGDYVVVTLERSTQSAGNLSQSVLLASDGTNPYTAAHTDLFADDDDNANFQVSYKKMGPTPDTTVTLSATGGAGRGTAVHIMALRGVDPTTPLDVTPTTATGTNTGDSNPPAITPSTAGALISVHVGNTAQDVYNTPGDLSSVTNHFKTANIDTTVDAAVAVGLKTDWASGSFNPAIITSAASSGSDAWCAVTIAWRPAP